MKRLPFAAAYFLLTVFTSSVWAQEADPAGGGDKEAAPARKAAPMRIDKKITEDRIRAALEEETRFDFTEMPLRDVVEFLEDLHKFQIEIDTKALDEAGFGSDVPVTRSLSGLTLASALEVLLNEIELTYIIENEVLSITTRKVADEKQSVELYPIRKLIDAGWETEAIEKIVKGGSDRNCAILGGYIAVIQGQPAHRKTAELMKKLIAAAESDK